MSHLYCILCQNLATNSQTLTQIDQNLPVYQNSPDLVTIFEFKHSLKQGEQFSIQASFAPVFI